MFRFRLISSVSLLREANLLYFQVFVRCSITILGFDIVLKSGSRGSSTLCLFIELRGSFETDCSKLRSVYNRLPGLQYLTFAAWYQLPGAWWLVPGDWWLVNKSTTWCPVPGPVITLMTGARWLVFTNDRCLDDWLTGAWWLVDWCYEWYAHL